MSHKYQVPGITPYPHIGVWDLHLGLHHTPCRGCCPRGPQTPPHFHELVPDIRSQAKLIAHRFKHQNQMVRLRRVKQDRVFLNQLLSRRRATLIKRYSLKQAVKSQNASCTSCLHSLGWARFNVILKEQLKPILHLAFAMTSTGLDCWTLSIWQSCFVCCFYSTVQSTLSAIEDNDQG